MAKWFSKDPEFTQISVTDYETRQRIVAILNRHTINMENYSYFGDNPGVKEDDYEDIAEEIMAEFRLAIDKPKQ